MKTPATTTPTPRSAHSGIHFSAEARQAITDEVRELAEDVGDDRILGQLASGAPAKLVGRFNPRTQIREGDTIEVAIDVQGLHFFDPETGRAIYDEVNGNR